MAPITFEHVRKQFGETVALEDFSLEIEDGEFVVLVGPSGSGKTTALRILAGLEALTGGHVSIGEQRVDMLPPRDRDIGMVFQDYGLYPQMSVYANLAFGLKMRKVGRDEIDRRVREAAAVLELDALLGRKPRQLSGGQRQRVALGRALVREPQAYLMDEPLSNLDAKLRVQMRGEIRRLQTLTDVTTIYVTHDQVEAMTMGDRVAVMSNARIEQVGTPQDLYQNPRNVFVAGFIGAPGMTFGRFSAARTNGSVQLRSGDQSLSIETAPGLPDEVLVGVRPEHARLWGDRPDLVGPLRGRVTSFEALGRESLLTVATGDGTRFIVQTEGHHPVQIDDEVTFGLRRGHLYFFDPETELAIERA
ncbi:MAG TPA: ABC transporter ATP-binding protein [Gaiellaceae bacterium]